NDACRAWPGRGHELRQDCQIPLWLDAYSLRERPALRPVMIELSLATVAGSTAPGDEHGQRLALRVLERHEPEPACPTGIRPKPPSRPAARDRRASAPCQTRTGRVRSARPRPVAVPGCTSVDAHPR